MVLSCQIRQPYDTTTVIKFTIGVLENGQYMTITRQLWDNSGQLGGNIGQIGDNIVQIDYLFRDNLEWKWIQLMVYY